MTSPDSPDPDPRAPRLARWLGRALELRPDAPVTIHGLAAPDTGMSSDTRLFQAEWAEGGEPRSLRAVLRAAPTEEGPFPEYDLPLQFHVMRSLAPHIPVPATIGFEADPSVLGSSFLVMREVDGEAPIDFRPSYHAAGFVRDATAEGRRAMWEQLIQMLARLHSLDWRTLDIPGLPGAALEDPSSAPLAYWGAYYRDWLKDDPSESIAVFDEALDFLTSERPKDPPVALLWGDAKLGNVMFGPESSSDATGARPIAAIVDWEMATLGDPAMDLASLWVSDQRAREDAGDALEGTPEPEEWVDLYEAAGGPPLVDFHYAKVFATFWRGAVQLKVMRRMRAAGADLPDELFTHSQPVRTLRTLLDL